SPPSFFDESRNSPPYPATRAWGVQYGGLVFLPITVLGAIGLVAALFSGTRYLLWLAVLLLGLALPALGCATARRLLVFDLGWCAFAAIGLGALTRAPGLRRVGRRGRVALATGFLGLMGAWTLAAMVILREGPSYHGLYSVPFATGCVRDVVTCARCVEAGRQWEDDIRRGSMVILVDSDLDREYATWPGGLPVYGLIGAAAAGGRDRFQELYPILWNVNGLPGVHHYYAVGGPPTVFLPDLLRPTPYTTIVWQSERPTAWERWVASRLVAAGGRMSTFATPLGDGPGFRVETDKSAESAVIDAIAAIAPAPAADALCISATPVKTEPLRFI